MVAWLIIAVLYVPLFGVAFVQTLRGWFSGARAHRAVRAFEQKYKAEGTPMRVVGAAKGELVALGRAGEPFRVLSKGFDLAGANNFQLHVAPGTYVLLFTDTATTVDNIVYLPAGTEVLHHLATAADGHPFHVPGGAVALDAILLFDRSSRLFTDPAPPIVLSWPRTVAFFGFAIVSLVMAGVNQPNTRWNVAAIGLLVLFAMNAFARNMFVTLICCRIPNHR